MSFILNRGKSFAARYKEYECKPEKNVDSQPPQRSKASKSDLIVDVKPVLNVCDNPDDDEIEIDFGLSRTGQSSGMEKTLKQKTKGAGGKKKKKSKKSKQNKNPAVVDRKPLIVPKFEFETKHDSIDDDNYSDVSILLDKEESYEDTRDPLNFTVIDTNDVTPLKDRKSETLRLKIKFDGKFHKFVVDYNDSIMRHLNAFHKAFGVSKLTHELVITYNDEPLSVFDTARSLNLTIVDFLEAYARERSVPLEKSKRHKVHRAPNSIELKVRNNQDGRHDKPISIFLDKNVVLSTLMKEYADKVELKVEDLIFEFDGDRLSGEETPTDYDMDDGSQIDVRIKRS